MGGLTEFELEAICRVFSEYTQVSQALIFGSRAMGNYKASSDIDIVVKGEKIDLSVYNSISIDLDDLLLPYKIDLAIYDSIDNEQLLDHIKRVGIVIYNR